MGSSSSVEPAASAADEPRRAGPSHEPSPPDDTQLREWRAALKDSGNNLKHGQSRQLKAAALGRRVIIPLSLARCWFKSWNSTGPTPTLGMRLSCNFVNVMYTIAYRVQYTCTRAHP